MSYIWTFSPESQELLQQCISAAAPPDESNKWLQKFGRSNLNLINKTLDTIVLDDCPEINESPTAQNYEDEDISNVIEEFTDSEIDILAKFDHFADSCLKSPKLLIKLAETLPNNTVEKLFQHILNCDDVKLNFLDFFYRYFVHNYIKRENSRFCSDILLQTYKKHPQYFNIALKTVLEDMQIQNNIINDFLLNLSAENLTKLLEKICDIEFTPEQFSYNLFNIYTAYKSCNKTDIIQNYIFSCLKTYSDHCSSDKNYGKLMLTFLQSGKNLKYDLDSVAMEALIEIHKSPFRRPCLSVLREINVKT